MLSRGGPLCAMRWWNKSQVLCRSCESLGVPLHCPSYRTWLHQVFWEGINGLWFSNSASHVCHNGGFQEARARKTRNIQIVITSINMLKTLNKPWDCLKSKTRSKDIFEIIKLRTLLNFVMSRQNSNAIRTKKHPTNNNQWEYKPL